MCVLYYYDISAFPQRKKGKLKRRANDEYIKMNIFKQNLFWTLWQHFLETGHEWNKIRF